MSYELVFKAVVSAILIGGLALMFRWLLKSLMSMVTSLTDECRQTRDALVAVRVELSALRERSEATATMARENRANILELTCAKCQSQ
jgi:hypothetical protein